MPTPTPSQRPTRDTLLAAMARFGACEDAIAWVKKTKGTPENLWARCRRGDWMLWLAAKTVVRPFCAADREETAADASREEHFLASLGED